MAELDPSIILSGKHSDIMGSIASGLKMKDLGIERKAKADDAAKSLRIQNAYKSNVQVNPDGTTSLNEKAVLGDLYKEDPMEAQRFEKQSAADKELQRQQKFNALKDETMAGREIAYSIADEASYQTGIKRAEELGLSRPGDHPPNYDPGYVKSFQNRYRTAAEQIAQAEKQNQWGHEDKSKADERDFELKKINRQEELRRGGSVLTQRAEREFQELKNKQAQGLLTQQGEQRMQELQAKSVQKSSNPAKMSISQAKQKGLYDSGAEAERQYQAAADPSKSWWNSFDPASSFQWVDKNDWAPNFLKSSEAQVAHSAQDRWIEAFLRDASGAAIPPSERGAYAKDFFPMSGDSAQVVADKAAARKIKMENARLASGENVDHQETPTAGHVEDGYVFQGGDLSDPKNWVEQTAGK